MDFDLIAGLTLAISAYLLTCYLFIKSLAVIRKMDVNRKIIEKNREDSE